MNERIGLVALAAVALTVLSPLLFMGWLARMGGWTELAAQYPSDGRLPDRRKWLGYGVFRGWVGYNGALIVASDARGLFLSTLPVLLSWAHPPVFIPWGEIERVERQRRLAATLYEIRTRRARGVRFALRQRTWDFVSADARAALVPGA